MIEARFKVELVVQRLALQKTAQTSNTRLKDTGILLIGLNYSLICGLVVYAISSDMVMLVIGPYWYSY